uniref:Uncharacterized protein n=1 Tax=Rhizophora mucronata TaxID=61149 RepID=A0A2P2QTF2_RHIMU
MDNTWHAGRGINRKKNLQLQALQFQIKRKVL